ncbi:hypothetical protein MNBD_GAMMA10-2003 [hydrothermal vent metagenome]|uniref:Uncharacterized protein n=1 Tax=hydrothermal vent metagenome TaxID=652676 RepID=A0A3B0XD46_9ZZZZ
MCPFPNAKMANFGGELNSYNYFSLIIYHIILAIIVHEIPLYPWYKQKSLLENAAASSN